ncbi:hypothetical protein ACRBEH_17850 [Vibrio cholerae]|uniref:Uncharacterized protein n=1 Tax=Vibrio cholerae TaxID=666 RepID=A0ABD7SQ64_VIBCL|nr:hypothetical protein [Vibrio cholerae]TQO61912.1 hypothetical protein FLM12_12390 [Vibrio cholerae]TXX66718.1 hypothetical protein FXF03_05340 [Vibrio cholerae]
MKQWLYEKSLTVFFITLAVYILIWCTVSYVGVYVTYVAGPILIVTGVIAYFCSPNEKEPS